MPERARPGNVPGYLPSDTIKMMTPDIAHTLHPYRQFLVAFSGGLGFDGAFTSTGLLRERDPTLQLRAIHIHHGLSANADSGLAHCQQVCQHWQVPLVVERVTLADDGLGVEAHARQARYQAFRGALRPGEALVTAQHLDDQCETFLLALKRGSGPTGLAAMAASSGFAAYPAAASSAEYRRETLHQWALAHQLSWIEDESNQDDTYDRNFLRLRVVPQLNARWPHFSEAVARSASLCGEQEQLLDELLAEDLAKLVADDGSLAIDALASMERAAPRRAAAALAGQALCADALARDDGANLARSRAGAGGCLSLSASWRFFPCAVISSGCGGSGINPARRMRCYRGRTTDNRYGCLKVLANWRCNQADRYAPRVVKKPVTVRFRASGNLHIVGRHGGRKLKKIWQELGVAPWRRDTTPLLFYGETLIAAADSLFVTCEGEAREGEGVRDDMEENGRLSHPFLFRTH
ncbi:tRNA(Ile)-lysidine synthase [Raoultella planticola]|uniref:tRNA(Ile)-lysidine synthase n=1 Tax=Raoultella planticola TaxID=575 RepID=A0A485B0S0_RAOPL|nr:tRNA(Ile)-lysidine synthase [Raoultella planticola]